MVEIEAKFIASHAKVRKKLQELGGRLTTPMRQMTRQNADIPGRENTGAWVRVRDEGDGVVTMSYKYVGERTLSGTSEICLQVDNFDNAVAFLGECGIATRNIQQTRRESWELDGASVDLDEWPWVPQFVEVEAESEGVVLDVARKLGLDVTDAIYGSVEPLYMRYYDVTENEVNDWKEIKFGPVPKWLEAKRIKSK
jgi:adenylate cyclase class 2